MGEPMYEVVWPLGRRRYDVGRLPPRVPDLSGKTVCELSDHLFRSEEIFPILRKSLLKRYPDIKFIEYSEFGNIHGAKMAEVIAALPESLRKHGCGAVISGVGA